MRIYKYYCLCAMMMMNCFCGMVDRRKTLSLISSRDIARDPHHRESPTSREQGMNQGINGERARFKKYFQKWESSEKEGDFFEKGVDL